jgi:hypothetical protein
MRETLAKLLKKRRVYAASQMSQLRKSSSAASQLLKVAGNQASAAGADQSHLEPNNQGGRLIIARRPASIARGPASGSPTVDARLESQCPGLA